MNGAAEAESKGGKIGPAAAEEPVDSEGREAEGKPVLLDENPHVDTEVTVGNVSNELAGAEKFTAFCAELLSRDLGCQTTGLAPQCRRAQRTWLPI